MFTTLLTHLTSNDRAPPHYATVVQNYTLMSFLKKIDWITRAIEMTPRSPDLTRTSVDSFPLGFCQRRGVCYKTTNN